MGLTPHHIQTGCDRSFAPGRFAREGAQQNAGRRANIDDASLAVVRPNGDGTFESSRFGPRCSHVFPHFTKAQDGGSNKCGAARR